MTDFEKLVRQFADNVAAQDVALQQCDSRAGNRFARRYLAAWDKLRSHGDLGRDALATLLKDPRPSVRLMAAAFLLRYRTNEAKTVLRKIARGRGAWGAFEAAQTLKRWAEGDWHLDPPEPDRPKRRVRSRRGTDR